MKKIIAIVSIIFTVGYFIPFLINQIINFNRNDLFSVFAILGISIAISLILFGFFGVIALLKEVKLIYVKGLFIVIALKHLLDAIYFEALQFVLIALPFILLFIFSRQLGRYISLENQVFILTIITVVLQVMFIIANRFEGVYS